MVDSKLSSSQKAVLDLLINQKKTVSEIALLRKTSVQAVYKTINKLKKKNYVFHDSEKNKKGFKRSVSKEQLFLSDLINSGIDTYHLIQQRLIYSKKDMFFIVKDLYERRLIKKVPHDFKGICRICGSVGYIEHHHIQPRSEGGNDGKENLICLCKICHLKQHGR